MEIEKGARRKALTLGFPTLSPVQRRKDGAPKFIRQITK